MVIKSTDEPVASLTSEREPTGVTAPGTKGTVGDQALMDGIYLIVLAWVIVFAIAISLNKYSI